jgi:hypothetical protein
MSNNVPGLSLRDIVMKLVGGIEPQGESSGDERRLESLKELTSLVDDLLMEIYRVSRKKISHEASVKHAGEYAAKFLSNMSEEYKA